MRGLPSIAITDSSRLLVMNARNSVGQIQYRRILRKLVPAAILTLLVALAVLVAAAWNNILSDGGTPSAVT